MRRIPCPDSDRKESGEPRKASRGAGTKGATKGHHWRSLAPRQGEREFAGCLLRGFSKPWLRTKMSQGKLKRFFGKP